MARRLPAKYKESMMRHLEDWDAQFKIWIEHPEELTEDESLHRGVVFVLKRLLEK